MEEDENKNWTSFHECGSAEEPFQNSPLVATVSLAIRIHLACSIAIQPRLKDVKFLPFDSKISEKCSLKLSDSEN